MSVRKNEKTLRPSLADLYREQKKARIDKEGWEKLEGRALRAVRKVFPIYLAGTYWGYAENGVSIRSLRPALYCPLTGACALAGLGEYLPTEYLYAGNALGLPPTVSKIIAQSADGAVDGDCFSEPVRMALVEVCHPGVEPPPTEWENLGNALAETPAGQVFIRLMDRLARWLNG